MGSKPSTTSEWIVPLEDLTAVQRAAGLLAELFRPPAVVLLSGPLGAGKTTLVQAILRQWGVTETVKSPTFDLVHLFVLPQWTVYHADLYRIESDDELDAVDLPPPGDPGAVVLVEWGERLVSRYPDYFTGVLTPRAAGGRLLTMTGHGQEAIRLRRWLAVGGFRRGGEETLEDQSDGI
ncbi:MAG: tRNA (adenosine(37)-N6)-threonylcarbamoyltransferase complex ATPase subunit type 1 TsaE [Thermaerobacter sp.]|nr:tRNA (adenosine(37)-N6)-threonylcarbamoyltransferase complex ATPase subunit type 1 TsaE [Thermaerobacter sp.]